MESKQMSINEHVKQRLASYNLLSSKDIALGLSLMTPKSFKKDTHLIQAGETCNWLAFIHSGVIRNYYLSEKGEEVTYCLSFPNYFITAFSSFIQGQPTFENIHALSEVEALFMQKKDYKRLISSSKAWLNFSKTLTEESYVYMENRLLAFQMQSADYRYQELLDKTPDYLQQIPLKYLASYLGVTPRHLSRIRGNVAL